MSIPTVTIFISGDGLRVVPSRCKKTFDVGLHNQLSQPGSIRLLYKYKKIFFANLANNPHSSHLSTNIYVILSSYASFQISKVNQI